MSVELTVCLWYAMHIMVVLPWVAGSVPNDQRSTARTGALQLPYCKQTSKLVDICLYMAGSGMFHDLCRNRGGYTFSCAQGIHKSIVSGLVYSLVVYGYGCLYLKGKGRDCCLLFSSVCSVICLHDCIMCTSRVFTMRATASHVSSSILTSLQSWPVSS